MEKRLLNAVKRVWQFPNIVNDKLENIVNNAFTENAEN